MKKESIIEFLVLIGVAVGGFFFLKKSKPKTDASTVITQESATKAYLPESTIIKASQVVIPKTAVVLPTASSVVQSSSIQEEDINSLDCDSLFLKYNTINSQLVELVTTDGSNASNISLLKNRKALIEGVMKNKKCVIPDPVLQSAVIESTIIAPPKYTNAEISDFADNVFDSVSTIDSYHRGQKSIFSLKLKDFLKTIPNKQDVNSFLILYPKLIVLMDSKLEEFSGLQDKGVYAYLQEKEVPRFLSTLDNELLKKLNFKYDLVYEMPTKIQEIYDPNRN